MKSAFWLTFIAILTSGALGDNSGVVKGEIMDASTGQALPRSLLMIIPEHGFTNIKQIVTSSGKFTILGVPAGTYRAMVIHSDYRSFISDQFYVRADEITELNFWLRLNQTRLDSLSTVNPGKQGVDYKMQYAKPPAKNPR
jgi:hypothetical protein